MDLTEISWEGMDWIAVAQDRDGWQELVNAVMSLQVPQNAGIALLDEEMLASQEGLCAMQLAAKSMDPITLQTVNIP